MFGDQRERIYVGTFMRRFMRSNRELLKQGKRDAASPDISTFHTMVLKSQSTPWFSRSYANYSILI